jgi:hypothetical protein
MAFAYVAIGAWLLTFGGLVRRLIGTPPVPER